MHLHDMFYTKMSTVGNERCLNFILWKRNVLKYGLLCDYCSGASVLQGLPVLLVTFYTLTKNYLSAIYQASVLGMCAETEIALF